MREIIKRVNEISERVLSPFLTVVWRLSVILGIVVWWAAKDYQAKLVAENPVVVGVIADTAALKVKASEFDVVNRTQAELNQTLKAFFLESRESREKVDVQLGAIGQQLTDQDRRLSRIETKLDRAN